MKQTFLISAALLLFATSASAQQDPQFSMNMFNRLFPNPAYAGATNQSCFTALFREQWAGYRGNPRTYMVSGHTPWKLVHGGIGGSVYGDQIGPISYTGGKLAYSFRQPIGIGFLGVGIGIGAFQTSIAGDQWVTLNADAPDGKNDPTLAFAEDMTGTTFDLDFGVYYNTDRLYAGLSTTHIPAGDVAENYSVARHFFLQAGYIYDLTSDISIQPSTLVKFDTKVAQVDINVSALYRDMFWGGISYRLEDAIAPILGFFYDGLGPGRLRVGYSYDVGLNRLNTGHSGSHEIMLNYCFKITPPVKVQRHRTVLFL